MKDPLEWLPHGIVGATALVLIVLILTLGSCASRRDRLVDAWIQAGKNPLEARCALGEIIGADAAICATLAASCPRKGSL